MEPTNAPQDTSWRSGIFALLTSLAVVDDPRGRKGKMHALVDVLAIAILGTICGCDDAEAFQIWAEKEEPWLRRFLALKHGIPTQDTYLRVLAALDPKQFRESFLSWAKTVFHLMGLRGQLAVDGKTLRGTKNAGVNLTHMINALSCETGLVVGQERTASKSNEITAIPMLLDVIALKGCLVSIDAMGCQTKIAQKIIDKEGDYLLGLKQNQPTLHAQVNKIFSASSSSSLPKDTTTNKGHGRIETRTATVCAQFCDDVTAARRWPQMKTLVRIESIRQVVTETKVSTETRYYICSRNLTAQQANQAVRAHWLVENQLHWCLDVTFGEDHNQTKTKHAAENLAVIRQFALNIMRNFHGDKRSLRLRRRQCDYNLKYREEVLAAAM